MPRAQVSQEQPSPFGWGLSPRVLDRWWGVLVPFSSMDTGLGVGMKQRLGPGPEELKAVGASRGYRAVG